MSVTRLGATKLYSDNWENIFGGGIRRSTTKKSAAKPARKSLKKSPKSAAKTGGKKRAKTAKRKGR
jgi:hypothetical protein